MDMRMIGIVSLAAMLWGGTLQAFWLFGTNRGSGDFLIATNGSARASIVVPKEAPKCALWAARHRGRHLGEMTGTSFAIADHPIDGLNAIRVGFPYEGRSDEICLKVVDPKTMEVTGEGARGPAYAACELLEKLGCRFWSEDVRIIPEKPSLSVEKDYALQYAPETEFRVVGVRHASFEWTVELRGNCGGDFGDGPKPWERFLGAHPVDVQYNHTLARTLPAKSIFKEHPDGYAYDPAAKKRSPSAICTTDERMYQTILADVHAYFKAHPERDTISVTPEDNGLFCQCPNCEKIRAQDPAKTSTALYVNFVNRLARDIRDAWPKKKIVLLAYWTTFMPPQTPGLKLESNARVAFASLWRNHGRPFTSCPWFEPVVQKWSTISPGGLYYWEYYANFSNYIQVFPNWDIIAPGMRYYAEHNFKGGFAQQPLTDYAPFGDWNVYIFNRMQWNPNLDPVKLRDEWLEGVYGKGAPHAKRAIAIAENARDRQRWAWIGCYVRGTSNFMTVKDCVEYIQAILRIEDATRSDPLRRLAGHKAALTAYDLMSCRYNDLLAEGKRWGFVPPSRERIHYEIERRWNMPRRPGGDQWGERHSCLGDLESFMKLPAQPTAFSKRHSRSIIVRPEDLNANGSYATVGKDETGRSVAGFDMTGRLAQFMDTGTACLGWRAPEGMTNYWYVLSCIRTETNLEENPGAAFFGIYQKERLNGVEFPNAELVDMSIERSRGDWAWRWACPGKYLIIPGTHIWIMDDVLYGGGRTQSRGFVLLEPEVLEGSFKDSPTSWAKSFGPRVKVGGKVSRGRNEIDGYDYIHLAEGGVGEMVFEWTEAGDAMVFVRVKTSASRALVNKAARVEVVRKEGSGGEVVLAGEDVSGSVGESAWQLVCLGKVSLKEGDVLRVRVTGGTGADWKAVVLAAPALFGE